MGSDATLNKAVSPREVLAWFGGAIAIIIALWFVGADELWRRPLWTDEVIMSFLLGEPSLTAMLDAIRRGGDWAPPLVHVMLWPLVKFAGGATPELLRSLALTSVTLAQAFVYFTLRRHVGVISALCGVLAVCANTMVANHAFEMRFYGPWLLCSAAFAWSLGLDEGLDRSRRRDIAVAASAVLLCSVHWFGVFALSIMLAGVLAAQRFGRAAVRRAAPAVAGVIVLLMLSPIALAQRVSAQGMLWVAPLNRLQIIAVANRYWFTPSAFVAMCLVLSAWWSQRGLGGVVRRLGTSLAKPDTAALIACLVMPVVLIAISLALSPSMIDRYAIVAALSWAPVVSFSAEQLRRRGRVVALLALTWFSAESMSRLIMADAEFAAQIASLSDANRDATALHVPVVFVRLHAMYAAAGPSRASTKTRMLTLPDATINALYPSDRLEWLRRTLRVERNIAVFHQGVFGFPRVVTQAELDTTSRFAVVVADVSLPGGYQQIERWGAMLFPGHHVTRISPLVSVFQR